VVTAYRRRRRRPLLALHQRLHDVLRQAVAHFGNGVPHVRHRAVDGRPISELNVGMDPGPPPESNVVILRHIAELEIDPSTFWAIWGLHFPWEPRRAA